jgi:hypothetical protein
MTLRTRSTSGSSGMTKTAAGPRRLSGEVKRTISPEMTLELPEEEATALARHLRQTVDYDPYPWAPRLDPLKSVFGEARAAEAGAGASATAETRAGRPTLGAAGAERRIHMSQQERLNIGTIIAALHDSEINGEVSVSWFFDRVWKMKLGDPLSGYDAEATVASIEEAAEWLRATAVRLYPDSEFAKLYSGFGPAVVRPCSAVTTARCADDARQRRCSSRAADRWVLSRSHLRCSPRLPPSGRTGPCRDGRTLRLRYDDPGMARATCLRRMRVAARRHGRYRNRAAVEAIRPSWLACNSCDRAGI